MTGECVRAGGSQAAPKAPGVTFLPGCFGPAELRAQPTLTFGSFSPGELGAEDGVTGGGDSVAGANAKSGNPATEAGGGADGAAAQPEQVASAPRENPMNPVFKSTAVDSAPGEVDSCGLGSRVDGVLPSPVADATGLHSVAGKRECYFQIRKGRQAWSHVVFHNEGFVDLRTMS